MTSLNVLTQKDILKILSLLSNTFEENKAYLSKLDTEIGDGDHGFSMAKGFHEISVKLETYADLSIGQILKKTGFELVNSIGGAAGAIFGTLFIGQASYYENHLSGEKELDLQDLSNMLDEALVKIKTRGNAQPGDKTMIDALEPAIIALSIAHQDGLSLSQAFQNASKAAKKGAESTKGMQGRRGRSKNLAERSIGYLDPGAISTFYIIKTISEYIDAPG